MCFRLTNAPATFMKLMNSILLPYLGKFVVVFLDDILIYSRTREKHLEHLRKVFQLLKENSLYAKESKCEFFVEEVKYLGHIISRDGIRMDLEKVQAILEWRHDLNLRT